VTNTNVTNSSGTNISSTTSDDLALVHYLANGARDLSFGAGGTAMTSITPSGVTTSDAWGTNVLVQPNGAIVEVGTATGSSGYKDTVLARYNANGTLDTSFGAAGYVLVDLGATVSSGTVALQPNGQILAGTLVATAFNQYGSPTSWGFATDRLNTNGSLDASFGIGGTVVTEVLYSDYYTSAVALETLSGQTMIVDAGTASNLADDTQYIGMVRYTPNGSLDSGGPDDTPAALSASSTTNGPMGIVPRVLESSDFLDTLLPGRRRR
jgi:uncharacterized delta-60 repeat protein